MQEMRHLNLFEKVTKVNTRFCFKYNGAVIFCVPERFVSKAIGEEGKNAKKIKNTIGRRIKIIAQPRGIQDAKKFVTSIINPVTFNNLEIKDNKIILTAGNQNKSSLFGRNKRRLFEMQKIIRDFFGKEFKII